MNTHKIARNTKVDENHLCKCAKLFTNKNITDVIPVNSLNSFWWNHFPIRSHIIKLIESTCAQLVSHGLNIMHLFLEETTVIFFL